MRIREIYTNPSRDEYPENYHHYFVNVNHQELLRTGLTLKVAKENESTHIGVFHDDDIVSYVGLHKEGPYNQIDMQCSRREYRGQGYIRKCIEYAINHFAPVISDVGQTQDAQQVWMALIQRPNILDYFWLNLDTNQQVPIKWGNGPTPNPWDETDEVVILALPRQTSAFIKEMRENRMVIDMKRNRRDPWLGPGFTEFNP
ncbi:NAT_SF domain containing protein [uncultured Caudovirales phage]|uniref:NAT_SF domain containing protein n=1 Tax=uncultured Caudovirales phage TaxID=2100421 RepID=A0A6J5KMJ0_9CAUD|nr:NAT_SF domain containing protein [uncultured Caudovirales phage]